MNSVNVLIKGGWASTIMAKKMLGQFLAALIQEDELN